MERWSRDWAGVAAIMSGPTLLRHLRANREFFETQSTGTYAIDIATVSTTQTVETRGGVGTVTDSFATETEQTDEARTIPVTLGSDGMRLLFRGTDGEWRFHGLVGVGRTGLLDSSFLGYRNEVDRVIFDTPACPGFLSKMFVNEGAVDALFGTILAGRCINEMNAHINLLSRTVIETVAALERIEG